MKPPSPQASEVMQRMAELARLSFPPEKLSYYSAKAQAILNYMHRLDELQLSTVAPTAHAVESTMPLRSDEPIASGIAQQLLQLAPERDGAYVQVPKVIDS